MEQQAADISWLNSEILKGLGRGVNLLIDKFPFDLVGRGDRPPEGLVEDTRNWLEDGLWNVDVSAVLDNFLVHHLGNLSSRIVLGTVEFVSLRSSAIVLEHFLKGLANIDGLERSELKPKLTFSYLREQASNALACG